MAYGGWDNYETWAVASKIGNKESSYNYWYEQAVTIKKEYEEDKQEYTLADMLQDDLEQGAEHILNEASVYSDLLRAAISEVDFSEIAKDLLETVETDEDNEEEEVSE